MSKAIAGAALLAGAAIALTVMTGGLSFAGIMALTTTELNILGAVAAAGVSMEAAAIAGALSSNRGMNITTRQAASARQIIRGMQRVGGVEIYRSTTGSTHFQFNYVIVLAGHECWAITGLYLDGRLVHFAPGGTGQTTRNGYTFGGFSDGNTYSGPNGVQYNFGDNGHGPLVYCEARYGDQLPGDVISSLTANDPTWTAFGGYSPYVGGCTYVYLKLEYDATQFPSEPEIRFTVMGKSVYDPRTGTTGFSTNAALHIADHISDPVFGLGDPNVNTAQLIAAANVCDESVALASGYSEARYSLNFHYDTSLAPGDALHVLLESCAGRVRLVGGEWSIFPAYWQGPSYSFGPEVHTDAIQWNATRSFDELFNRVTGTYIAPNYPYNVAGDLYDRNGFYEGQMQNNWPFAWQPTNFPQYACDPAHGYAADEYLNDDSGVLGAWSSTTTYETGDVVTSNGAIWKSLIDSNLNNTPAAGSADWVLYSNPLPREISFQTVCSVSQAQRLAKIALLRNRFQGTGVLSMHLTAYRMQSLDVMQLNFPFLGWTNKVLEVDMPVLRAVRDQDSGAVALRCQFNVCETDASIYEWSTSEEQNVYAVAAFPASTYSVVQPPTGLTLVSGASTAVVGADGVVYPRIRASWTTPQDPSADVIRMRYRVTATTAWIDCGTVDISMTEAFTPVVVAGQGYDVQIRAERPNRSTSVWVELDNFIPDLLLSSLTVQGIGVGSLVGEAYSGGTASIECDPFTALIGQRSVSYFPSGAKTITTDGTIGGAGGALAQQKAYFVYLVDVNAAGGDTPTPIATANRADYLGKLGYWLIDSIVTPYASSSGGSTATRYAPSTYSDTGTRTTSSPGYAYDGNLSTYAKVSGIFSQVAVSGQPPDVTSANGDCTWFGFSTAVTSAATTLYVVASCTMNQMVSYGTGSGSIVANVAGTQTTLANFTASAAQATYSVPVPSGTDLSKVSVEVTADGGISGTTGTATSTVNVLVTEIYVQ